MVKLQFMDEATNGQSKQTRASSSENSKELLKSMRTVLGWVMDEATNGKSKQTRASCSENSEKLLKSMRTLLDWVMDEAKSSSENSKELLKSMRILLNCVDHKIVEACSISVVPEQLRKSKAEAYTPQVVSIGPMHRGTRKDLLYMEEIKWRCMKHLFNRTKIDENTCLKKCSKAMWVLDEIVRASYVDEVKFNRHDLAKISVLDGCFLLELFISGSPKLNEQLKCSLGTSPGADVAKREHVLSDLTLLENQIPFIVLDTLSKVLFRELYNKVDCTKLIHECALSILGYNYSSSGSDYELRGFHLVELVHSLIDKEKGESKDLKIPIEKGQVADQKLKVPRCATRLEAARVKIKPPETKNKGPIRFDLKIMFSDGKLEIPELHITGTTEAKWRNLIAWELNRTSLEEHRGRTEDKTSCQFISYAWFIQSLICCVHDVKLLRDREVILVDSDKGKNIMSDEDLMNLFRNITRGVSDSEIERDPWFVQEIQKLNTYTETVNRNRKSGRIMWHILRCILTWLWYLCRASYWALRRDYIPSGWGLIAVIAAAFGLLLTAIQTHYAIHPAK